MKKKLSGILALSMTLALTFSMTAFASASVNAGDQAAQTSATQAQSTTVEQTTVTIDGTEQTVALQAQALSAGEVSALATQADTLSVPGGYTKAGGVTPISIDINAGAVVVPVGTAVQVKLTNAAFEANTTYWIIHIKKDGNVESTYASTDANKSISFTLDGLSPVTFIKLDKAGENNNGGNNSNNSSEAPATTTSAADSPKTGETLPVASAVALTILAGAVVCARKIRFDRQ